MADDEHLKILRQGVAAWNEWREQYLDVEPDLSGAKLIAVDLREANLGKADLSEANLGRADLSEANLSEANLSGAILIAANLIAANLSEANLARADLSRANLSKADLRWVDLREANLREANITEANLRWADLSKAVLTEADLRWADLRGANLRWVVFREEDLELWAPTWVDSDKSDRYSDESVSSVEEMREGERALEANLVEQLERFEVSVTHPRRISKGVSSLFQVKIYPPNLRFLVEELLKSFHERLQKELKEERGKRGLKAGSVVDIEITSQDIEFSPSKVTKKLEHAVNRLDFNGKPKDCCEIREDYPVILSISDSATGNQLVSMPFVVEVVDYAFDHVPPRNLSYLSLFMTVTVSIAVFLLVGLGQVDVAIGIPGGLFCVTLACIAIFRLVLPYHRRTTTVNPHLRMDI